MKRILAAILSAAMILSLAACGEKPADVATDPTNDADITLPEVETDTPADAETPETQAPEEAPVEEEIPAKEEEQKPAEKPAQKPAEKPVEPEVPATPEKPAAPVEKPVQPEAPVEPQAPVEEQAKPTETASTLGQTLLKDFKSRANGASAQAIADGIMTNPAILFAGAAMPVEPGLLSGFDNAEITGFKEGVMFAPMIGSIPFVGYVFVLDDGTDADAFVANLKTNANPRWNICVEAEETVVDRVGNTVFFLMCPKSLEE